MSDRVFLDANILVSAAWRPDSGLLALWTLTDVTLLTSAYAIVEADRNMRTPEQRTRLHRLVQRVGIVDARDHFGAYFDKSIEGVLILRPSVYLNLRSG